MGREGMTEICNEHMARGKLYTLLEVPGDELSIILFNPKLITKSKAEQALRLQFGVVNFSTKEEEALGSLCLESSHIYRVKYKTTLVI